MRGNEDKQAPVFSYVSLEERVPAGHPASGGRDPGRNVEAVRRAVCANRAAFDVARAPAASAVSVRSERMLMQQLDYNLLFRWFVGLEIDEPVWHHAVFSKNPDRLLNETPLGGRLGSRGPQRASTSLPLQALRVIPVLLSHAQGAAGGYFNRLL